MKFSTQDHALANLLVNKNVINKNTMMQIFNYMSQQNKNVSLENFLLTHNYISKQHLQDAHQLLSKTHPKYYTAQITSQPKQQDIPDFRQSQLAHDFKNQKSFSHYEIVGELGRGGMGVVFKAKDLKLGRIVALKVILATTLTEKKIKRFLEEAKATARLKHEHIVNLYEIDNVPMNYFTMEFINGKALSDYIGKGLKLKESLVILNKCALAIDYAHQNKIIHRDIKPSNIMLDERKNPKIMDFGLAKDVEKNSDLSRKGDLLGTPAYMSPEQASGLKVDARSDVYSLGATMYQMLVGRTPFQGDSYWKVLKKLHIDEPMSLRSLNADIPLDVEAICLKCLEKKPEKRYKNAALLAKDIENFLHDRPISAKTITFRRRVGKWIKRNKSASAILSLIFGILILLLIFSINLQKLNTKIKIETQKAQKQKQKAEIEKQKAILAKQKAEAEKQKAITAQKKAEKREYQANILLAKQHVDLHEAKEAKIILNNCLPKTKVNWEWKWLSRKADMSLPLPKAFQNIKPISLTSSKKFIVIGSIEGKTLVYNLKNKSKKYLYGDTSANVIFCRFSKDGKYLATLYSKDSFPQGYLWQDTTLDAIVWNTHNWKRVANFKHQSKKQSKAVSCLFSNNNRKLIVTYRLINIPLSQNFLRSQNVKKGENIIIWDINSKKVVAKKTSTSLLENDVNDAIFFDKNELLIAGRDKKYADHNNKGKFSTLWNFVTNKERDLPKMHKKKIIRIAKNNKGYFALASDDNTVVIIDKKMNIHATLQGHKSRINDCKFSPNGRYLASASEDHKIILWDMKSFSKVAILSGHIAPIYFCEFYPNGNKLLSCGEDGLKIWNVNESLDKIFNENPFIFPAEKYSITDCVIHDDNKKIAFATAYDFRFKLTFLNGKEIFPRSKTNLAFQASVVGPVRYLKFHPTKTNIIVNCTDYGNIYFWNIKTGHQIAVYYGHRMRTHLRHFSFRYDGKRIATTSYDRSIRVWNSNIKSSKKSIRINNSIFLLMGYNGNINACDFYPNNEKHLLIGAGQHCIKIWDIDEKKYSKEKQNIRIQPKSTIDFGIEVLYCAFTFDGKYIIASLRNVKNNLVAYDVNTLKHVHTFEGHQKRVNIFSFIPKSKGTRLASGSSDGTIKIWDLKNIKSKKSSKPLLTINADSEGVEALTFSKDGEIMISGGFDKTVKIWRLGNQ